MRAGRARHALVQQLPRQHQGACLPARLPAHLPARLPTYLPAYLPACLPAYLPARLPQADAVIAWDEHFKHLPDAVRAPLFDDYVEEITAWVLGADKALPFWQQCFLSENSRLRFFKTHPGSEEHIRLWQET